MSNKKIQPDPSNHPNDSTANQVDPFTLIEPSTMNVNDLPDDCLCVLLKQFESLQDLVEKAFVCPRWAWVVHQILKTRQNSLKMFDSERNIESYKETVRYELTYRDRNARLHETGDTREDHIFVQMFNNDTTENVLDILMSLFPKVKHLVLQSLSIDHAKLICHLNQLTSITLVELPDSRIAQNQIWDALNECPLLRHVHIFYINGLLPLNVGKMDFLTKVQSFTLGYYKPDNTNAILNRLSSECRCLQISKLTDEAALKVLEKLIDENPQLVASLTHIVVRLEYSRDPRALKFVPLFDKFQALTYSRVTVM